MSTSMMRPELGAVASGICGGVRTWNTAVRLVDTVLMPLPMADAA
ncbi:hypothetical protein [Brachybacterium fresconis]|uniref:Uncharacterized protein n=1 Tax=Brachybacterium fresconis TaxID=173363 RepID=A0ABS4YLF5_9MICO|nr:hypothetical protein [Brachybacterium fresconis]MBP2409630.1 hypothetical protein [Brachybacterium fresconis]